MGFILSSSIVFLRMMAVMLVTMLMVMILFLISSFDFWLSNDDKAIFNQFSHLLPLKLSCFRFRIAT